MQQQQQQQSSISSSFSSSSSTTTQQQSQVKKSILKQPKQLTQHGEEIQQESLKSTIQSAITDIEHNLDRTDFADKENVAPSQQQQEQEMLRLQQQEQELLRQQEQELLRQQQEEQLRIQQEEQLRIQQQNAVRILNLQYFTGFFRFFMVNFLIFLNDLYCDAHDRISKLVKKSLMFPNQSLKASKMARQHKGCVMILRNCCAK